MQNVEADKAAIQLKILWTLWRRRRLAVLLGLSVFAVVFGVAAIQPKKYSATALVMVSPNQARVVSAEQALTGEQPDSAAVETAIEMLRSPYLAQRVATTLKLESDPRWSSGAAHEALPGTESLVVQKLMRAISTHRKSLSYVVEVTAEAPSAQQAAAIANTLVQSYQIGREELRDTTMNDAGSWLSGRLTELRNDVQKREAAIAQFRADGGLLNTGDTSLTEMQIASIQTSVLGAEAERAEKVARYTQVMQAAKRGAADTLGAALGSETMKELRAREADLTRAQADLENRYGRLHPEVQNGRAEIDNIRARIAAEVARIVASAANEADVANARLASLKANLDTVRAQLISDNTAGVQLRQMEREAAAARAVYESFLKRYQEIAEQGKLGPSDAMIVSKAMAPRHQDSPKLAFAFVVAVLLGGVSAVGGAFLSDHMRDSLGPERAPFGYPIVATIPYVSRNMLRLLDPGDRSIGDYLVAEPFSRFAEAYRKLRAAIVFIAAPELRTRVVAVTSAVAGEGKSTTALCLARTAAMAGHRAILLDCDFRNPSTNEFFGIAPNQGLREVLLGKVPWRDVVGADPRTSAHVIPSAATEAVVEEVFPFVAMGELIDELRAEYDLVVLNCPPVLLVADAIFIAPQADQVLFVAHWDRSSRAAMRVAIDELKAAGANIAGIALNCVDFMGWTGIARDNRYYPQQTGRAVKRLEAPAPAGTRSAAAKQLTSSL